jgi:hypothetical protein
MPDLKITKDTMIQTRGYSTLDYYGD